MFFYVPQKKETHTGLKGHEGEYMVNYPLMNKKNEKMTTY